MFPFLLLTPYEKYILAKMNHLGGYNFLLFEQTQSSHQKPFPLPYTNLILRNSKVYESDHRRHFKHQHYQWNEKSSHASYAKSYFVGVFLIAQILQVSF